MWRYGCDGSSILSLCLLTRVPFASGRDGAHIHCVHSSASALLLRAHHVYLVAYATTQQCRSTKHTRVTIHRDVERFSSGYVLFAAVAAG